jgi:hypothetical protein
VVEARLWIWTGDAAILHNYAFATAARAAAAASVMRTGQPYLCSVIPLPYHTLASSSPLQFMLAALLRGSATGVALSPLPLLRALLQTILAPLLIGVSIRAFIPGTHFHIWYGIHHFRQPPLELSIRGLMRRGPQADTSFAPAPLLRRTADEVPDGKGCDHRGGEADRHKQAVGDAGERLPAHPRAVDASQPRSDEQHRRRAVVHCMGVRVVWQRLL